MEICFKDCWHISKFSFLIFVLKVLSTFQNVIVILKN